MTTRCQPGRARAFTIATQLPALLYCCRCKDSEVSVHVQTAMRSLLRFDLVDLRLHLGLELFVRRTLRHNRLVGFFSADRYVDSSDANWRFDLGARRLPVNERSSRDEYQPQLPLVHAQRFRDRAVGAEREVCGLGFAMRLAA